MAAERAAGVSLQPGGRIAILGGGQLGRMLAMAAARLGLHCTIYSDSDDSPAFEVADRAIRGSYEDLAALGELARTCDVLTYEFENVPVAAARHLEGRIPVRPGPRALEVAQDRLTEKRFMEACGLPVAPYRPVDDVAMLETALSELGGAAILKTRRLGYDGKGQVNIAPGEDCAAALAEIDRAPAVLEKRVAFHCEVSVLVARATDGSMVFYDCPRNRHEGGILRVSSVPSGLDEPVLELARDHARAVAEALDYVGVLAVEMFYLGPQASAPLLINEMAPRVHNSGHWTMDACLCDQFENHIRAVAGWPLGDPARLVDVEMHNLIGADVNEVPEILREAGAVLHLYGKAEARPGRKMGHVNRFRGGSGNC